MQFVFSLGKGTPDAIFMIRQVHEKMLERNKTVYMAFLDFREGI